LQEAASSADLEVDGGIDQRTAPLVVRSGANVLIAGSAVFGTGSPVVEAVSVLRRSFQASDPE